MQISLFDRTSTEVNVTVAPLYVEIDNLQDQIKSLRSLLSNANDDVDDKLRKLHRAGTTTVDLASQLEEAQKKLYKSEKALQNLKKESAEMVGSEEIVRELKEVKSQLVKERADLLHELVDIKQVS